MSIDITDYLVQNLEPQNSILHRKGFLVNIRLYKNNKDYREIIDSIISYMKKVLYLDFKNYYRSPIGISGANIGVPFNIIIVKEDPDLIMINPKIKYYSEEQVSCTSGCGSLIGYEPVTIKRSTEIKVKYFDLKTKKYITKLFTGFEASVIQHEVDHNRGILIIDLRILES